MRLNQEARNFRIVCPDELDSNRLGAVLDVTDRQYVWPLPEGTEQTSCDGRVLEVLSEHNCQGWLQGYLLTGRDGRFPCYEAFLSIVDGMMNQYAKFLKSALEVSWRESISSLNYLLTSEAWRQEHNGYSHQGPGFINNLLTKKGHTYRIYLPPDSNCLIMTMEHCLQATNFINVTIASKQPLPQGLPMEEAGEHCRVGASIWLGEHERRRRPGSAAGLLRRQSDAGSIGCRRSLESRGAGLARACRQRDGFVGAGRSTKVSARARCRAIPADFSISCQVVFNFHGYTAAIEQLLWDRPETVRFDMNGYREEGTTTTPFDMQVCNKTSRYHVVIQAAQKVASRNPGRAAQAEAITVKYERLIKNHRLYILAHGNDSPEISEWRWPVSRLPEKTHRD